MIMSLSPHGSINQSQFLIIVVFGIFLLVYELIKTKFSSKIILDGEIYQNLNGC